MDSLRWVLLTIGALIVLGIYLWDFYANKRKPKRHTEVIFNPDPDSELPMTAFDDEPRDYIDAISGLNKILHEEENNKKEKSDSQTVIRRGKISRKYNVDDDFFGKPLVNDVLEGEELPPEDEILILRVIAKEGKVFEGLKLLTATKNVEMKFGNMNIFHHYGVGQMKSDKPLFSLANMFEPGEFNLQEMDSFTTKGVVIYMSLPTSVDAIPGFELMLSTCQRLADELGGELRGMTNEALDDHVIQSMREKAQRFANT